MPDEMPAVAPAPRRRIAEKTRLFLYVQAGGRCEFDGCNRYLLEHPDTFSRGNFGQQAHIYAFNEHGPRGHEGVDPSHLNDVSNLILLCPLCHKLVDDHPDQFTVSVLRKFKRAHEDRIRMLTDTKPNRQTVALRLTANVRSHPVEISIAEIQEAVAPNYFDPREIVDIDLTGIPDVATAAYWKTAAGTIKEKVARLYDRPGPVDNISVFALAPIPLLVFLGAQLSNKIRTAFFQRHRDPQTWTWKEGPSTATYSWTRHREGTDPKKVAVIFSLSGRVHLSDLPDQVDEQFTIYELALDSSEPSPYFLNTTGDLTRFRVVYNDAIRSLNATHEGMTALHLFPAVPAPVAVAMGWELLPKRDPTLLVYDYDNQGGGFRPTLEVNPHD